MKYIIRQELFKEGRELPIEGKIINVMEIRLQRKRPDGDEYLMTWLEERK